MAVFGIYHFIDPQNLLAYVPIIPAFSRQLVGLPAWPVMYAGDPMVRQSEFVNLLKDTTLAAFALHLASNSPN